MADRAAPPAGVAVDLREDDAGERQGLGEGFGGGESVLAGHGVEDEQHLVGLDRLMDPGDLRHHLLVDAQPPGGVDDHDVGGPFAALEAVAGDLDRVGLPRLAVEPDARLAGEHLELADGRRALEVGSHQQHLAPLLLEMGAELGGQGRLS